MTDTRAGADAADQRRDAAIEVAIRTGLLKRCPVHDDVFDPGQHDFQGASMVATYLVNQSHPVVATFGGDRAARFFPAICAVGGLLSMVAGFTQSRRIRLPVNARFLGVLAALLGFAALFPFVLGAQPTVRAVYAYVCLVAMQAYVVAGLWTDTYLLWAGLLVTVLVLAGVVLFPAIFWIWMAVCGGGTLIATGFYVRHGWRSRDA